MLTVGVANLEISTTHHAPKAGELKTDERKYGRRFGMAGDRKDHPNDYLLRRRYEHNWGPVVEDNLALSKGLIDIPRTTRAFPSEPATRSTV